MANEIDRVYMSPSEKIPFKSGCKFQIEAIMNNTLKPRPKLPRTDFIPAA